MVSMPPVPLDDPATLATKWWRQEADYGDVPLAVVAGAERRMPDGLLASVVDQDPVTEGFRTYAGALVGSDARTSLFRFAS
jgi:hypothetical protein